jgi:hypothetical protein
MSTTAAFMLEKGVGHDWRGGAYDAAGRVPACLLDGNAAWSAVLAAPPPAAWCS